MRHFIISSMPEHSGRLKVGQLVEVSFGRQLAQAVVIGFSLTSEFAQVAKPIRRIVDTTPILTEAQIQTAQWMSQTYLAPLSECVRLFIPPGLSKRGDVQIIPLVPPDKIESHSDTQQRLLNLLAKRGPLRGRQIARALPKRDWRGAVDQLVDRGVMLRESILDPPSVSPKTANFAELVIHPNEVPDAIDTHYNLENLQIRRHNAALRRSSILEFLAQHQHAVEVGTIYATIDNSTITDLRVLAEDDLIILREREVLRDPLADRRFVPDVPPQLTHKQAEAWHQIQQMMALDSPKPVLLHGVTGSGKTEIYLRTVEHALKHGQGAIVMVPEIALTPQTVRRFGARFPGQLGLIHSQLSIGERYDTWRRIREGQYRVVIGPRSALFSPVQNLGVIILDEAHDDSYKQTPPINPPYYHAVDAAIAVMEQTNGLVILGTATPNITQYSWANEGEYQLIELPARIMGHRQSIEQQAEAHHVDNIRYQPLTEQESEAMTIDLPPVSVVDMRQELRIGNKSVFSRDLAGELQAVIARGEQAILFLNRRGSATHVVCRDCGHVITSPTSDIPMTYHSHGIYRGKLVDHYTGYTMPHPKVCPNCQSRRVKFFGGETQKLEEELHRRFPLARVVRWDTDTVSEHNNHEQLLDEFVTGKANVLVGTQMVAKGLDLPMVTLVGVISADTALYLPDYRSNERTFQLLTQVAGRAGRGLLGGRVIIQTYEPSHYAIQAASNHDFHVFFAEEYKRRQEIGYPPYNRLLKMVVRGYDVERVEQEARKTQRSTTKCDQ